MVTGPARRADLPADPDPVARARQAMVLLRDLRDRELALTAVRDAAVAELSERGDSYAQIAAAVGLTRGRVAQIVRRHRAGPQA